MDTIGVLLIVSATVNIFLGLFVYARASERTGQNLVFTLVVFNIVVWTLTKVGVRYATTPEGVLMYMRAIYALPLFMPVLFLHFSYLFSGSTVLKRPVPIVALMYVYTVIFALITLFTDVIVVGAVYPIVGEGQAVLGTFYGMYSLHYFLFFTAAFFLILQAYHESHDENYKHRAILLFIGSAATAIIGMTTNLLLPIIGIFDFTWIANISTILYVSVIMYAIARYGLFNLRVISVELLTALVVSVLMVEVFMSKSVLDFYVRLFALILILILAAFLIKTVYREIEQRKVIEAQNKELAEANEERSEFLTFASHEIRNPLTAIRGYASLMYDGTLGPISPDARDGAQKIIAAGEEMLVLISQFLNKSKMELGKLEYYIVPFDVCVATLSVVERFRPHAEQKKLDLRFKAQMSGTCMVLADENKVKEIVAILIDNAIKYTHTGSIEVAIKTRGEFAHVSVSDSGAGIEKELIPNLFKKFSRADAKKLNMLGTGVGLYLARTLTESMGGKVLVESKGKGQGSVFSLQLPLAR